MKRYLTMGVVGLILVGFSLACQTNGPVSPWNRFVAEYVGSKACESCHQDAYNKFVRSGHPYKLNKVTGHAPVFPYSSVPFPPDGYTWNDVSYVLGGYHLKARFIGNGGYFLTGQAGSKTEYHIATKAWVAFHPGEQRPFTCARCHVTGYSDSGHQGGMPGITGTWALEGVQCERCHGPGSLHAQNPTSVRLLVDTSVAGCAVCHADNVNEIPASKGFIDGHGQQAAEFTASPHNGHLTCVTCHNPMASAIYADATYNPNKGIKATCESCHPKEAANQKSAAMKASGTCMDCHMPPMDKSTDGNLKTFTADVFTHLFKINTDPEAPQFSEDGKTSNPYITIPYACQHCHIKGGSALPQDLVTLAAYAKGYHSSH